MRVVHLTSSTFFGGPERQMLGLAQALPADYSTAFWSFREGGRCGDFVSAVRAAGFAGVALREDTPHWFAAISELTERLRMMRANVLLCHGYKANLLGRPAARRVGIPVIAVSRGWTSECWKVRVYEWADQMHLRFMDHVIAVSDGQAVKVRQAGVPVHKLSVIRNAARLRDFSQPDPAHRRRLEGYFAPSRTPLKIVVAAGRLSPEKGFADLIAAAQQIVSHEPAARFVLFGAGVERANLEQQIANLGLGDVFKLGGFISDFDQLIPWADLFVLPSYTEGLPNVVLEASTARVPVVATAVGGTPEVLADGQTGYLFAPGDRTALVRHLRATLASAELRRQLGHAGHERMHRYFTFAAQSQAYVELFEQVKAPLAERQQPAAKSYQRSA
jgi:glycosyltransferase involved in cell wall biosynthesis